MDIRSPGMLRWFQISGTRCENPEYFISGFDNTSTYYNESKGEFGAYVQVSGTAVYQMSGEYVNNVSVSEVVCVWVPVNSQGAEPAWNDINWNSAMSDDLQDNTIIDIANSVYSGLGAVGFANGAKEQLLDLAAKADATLKQTKYVKAVRMVSKGVFVAQVGISFYRTRSAFISGNDNRWGVAGKATLDITMGAVAVWGGPVGWGVAGVYFIGDVAGLWGTWGELE